MPIGWGPVAAAGIKGIIDGITAWLMSDDDEDKRLEAEIMLDRERRRLPDWAYARLKQLLTGPVTPSGMGGGMGAGAPAGGAGMPTGAFQRVSGGGRGMEAPGAPGGVPAPGGGMQSRIRPQSPVRLPPRNQQLRTFLTR